MDKETLPLRDRIRLRLALDGTTKTPSDHPMDHARIIQESGDAIDAGDAEIKACREIISGLANSRMPSNMAGEDSRALYDLILRARIHQTKFQ